MAAPWKWRLTAAEYLGLGLSATVFSLTPEIKGPRLWIGGTLVALEVLVFIFGRLEKVFAWRDLRASPEFEHWMDLLRAKDTSANAGRSFALEQVNRRLAPKYSSDAVDGVLRKIDEEAAKNQ
jgi:hypothetical protein